MVLGNKRASVAALLICAINTPITAQAPAGETKPISFDVASVKLNKDGNVINSNFPLGPGDVYTANGGHFTATNFPLITYISFAYRVMGDQAQALVAQLPGWATTDRFDIVAQTDGDPAKDTKNQMRLMMRALLADRFRMVTHFETHQVPVLGLLQVKPENSGRGCRRMRRIRLAPLTFPPPPARASMRRLRAVFRPFAAVS